jgi:hypothetical protein
MMEYYIGCILQLSLFRGVFKAGFMLLIIPMQIFFLQMIVSPWLFKLHQFYSVVLTETLP